MERRTAVRLRHLSLFLLCVAAGLLAPTSAGAAAPAGCASRVNDTPAKLIPCIRTADLWAHMQKFQAIADANPGADGHPSRNSGEPGYRASVDYVADVMRKAGYDVTIQPYTFDYTSFVGDQTFSEVSPTAHDYALNTEWDPARSNGTLTNTLVQPAGGIVEPADPNGSTSTSGCTPDDFAGFTPGNIALIQRGSCTFGTKVTNATNAHASGVIIFNEGNPGRTNVINGSVGFVPAIPVAFTSSAVGFALNDQHIPGSAPTVSLKIQSIEDPNRADYNVIAESKGGDPNNVLVVDAHLDAIFGAGMLDNASGSATILDIAQMMKKVKPLHKLRFIWFGGEELGLLGSAFYVNTLTPTELGHIGYDLDADVTATRNYSIGVLDPAAPDFFGRTVSTQFPPQVYQPSQVSRDQLINYYDSIGKNHILFSPVGTDAETFNLAGIPAGGVLTGQDCCKTQQEVDLFGGELGNYDGNLGTTDGGCVDNPFRWCDNLSNNDPNVLTFVSQAFANSVVRMAFAKDFAGTQSQSVKPSSAAMKRAAATDNGRLATR